MGTLKGETLKGEAPRTRHLRCRGVDSGKGVPIPSQLRSLGNLVSSPSLVRAEPRPKTNFVILPLWVLYWWLLCLWFWGACFTPESSIRRL